MNQQVILAGLYAGGFFESAAFYGGTCLRIFHGLQRFSEDMDFSLLTQDDKFDFTKYFPAIVDAFTMVGREVEIKKKDFPNREIYKDKDRSRYLPTVELQDGTEAIASAIFIYDPLFYTSRLVCRQDARLSISCVEEQSKRS